MLRNYKSAFSVFLHGYIAFRDRSFSFRLFTLLAVAASILIITGGIYRQLMPKYKETNPAELAAALQRKTK